MLLTAGRLGLRRQLSQAGQARDIITLGELNPAPKLVGQQCGGRRKPHVFQGTQGFIHFAMPK